MNALKYLTAALVAITLSIAILDTAGADELYGGDDTTLGDFSSTESPGSSSGWKSGPTKTFASTQPRSGAGVVCPQKEVPVEGTAADFQDDLATLCLPCMLGELVIVGAYETGEIFFKTIGRPLLALGTVGVGLVLVFAFGRAVATWNMQVSLERYASMISPMQRLVVVAAIVGTAGGASIGFSFLFDHIFAPILSIGLEAGIQIMHSLDGKFNGGGDQSSGDMLSVLRQDYVDYAATMNGIVMVGISAGAWMASAISFGPATIVLALIGIAIVGLYLWLLIKATQLLLSALLIPLIYLMLAPVLLVAWVIPPLRGMPITALKHIVRAALLMVTASAGFGLLMYVFSRLTLQANDPSSRICDLLNNTTSAWLTDNLQSAVPFVLMLLFFGWFAGIVLQLCEKVADDLAETGVGGSSSDFVKSQVTQVTNIAKKAAAVFTKLK